MNIQFNSSNNKRGIVSIDKKLEYETKPEWGCFKFVVFIVFLAIVIAMVMGLLNVIDASALGGGKYPVSGAKVSFATIEKVENHVDCNYPGWHPEPWYYLDNDGTPEETAYSDYLEDLSWFHVQYPNACEITPEPFTK